MVGWLQPSPSSPGGGQPTAFGNYTPPMRFVWIFAFVLLFAFLFPIAIIVWFVFLRFSGMTIGM